VEDDLQLARRAALAGAAVALRYFGALTGLRHERKVDGSVVTEADRAVEATIRTVLTGARPGDAVLGEEGGRTGAGGAGRRWIVDPIDGTALFVAGDDRWLVLVALEEDGEIVAGVAVVPVQGRIWWARRGSGAWEADADRLDAARRISVARVDGGGAVRPGGAAERVSTVAGGAPAHPADLRRSRLGVLPTLDDPVTGANVVPKAPEVVAALLAVTPARPWALHPPLLVARGDLDLAVQTSGQVWDFAATSLIVAEAGGVYAGLDGRTRPGPGPSVFARDEPLRDAALAVLRGASVRGPGCA
jgi:histidinol-phosphatase